MLGWGGGAQLAFVHGLWLPVVDAGRGAGGGDRAACCCSATGLSIASGGAMQAAFRHYLAPDLVDAAGGASRAPAARRRDPDAHRSCSADIRGFTSISETLQSQPAGAQPADQPRLPVADDPADHGPARHDRQIHGRLHHGVLERAARRSGHADHACDSALAMLAELDRINAELAAEAAARGPRRSSRSISASGSIPANASSATWARTSASPIPRWATR